MHANQTPALVVTTSVVVVQTAPAVVVQASGGVTWPELLIAGVSGLAALAIAWATIRTFALQRKIAAEQERHSMWARSLEDPSLKIRKVEMLRSYDPAVFELSIEFMNPGKVDLKLEQIIAGFGGQWGLYHDEFDSAGNTLVVKPYALNVYRMSQQWRAGIGGDERMWPTRLSLTVRYIGTKTKYLHMEFEIQATTGTGAMLLPDFDGLTLPQST